MGDYYERNYNNGQMERVTPQNIVAHLVNLDISKDEAVERINRLLEEQKKDLVTPVSKEDWKYIYETAKEEWAKYDGVKPTGEALVEIRKVIKQILRDELKIEPHGSFMNLNKLTYNENKQKIKDLLYKMI